MPISAQMGDRAGRIPRAPRQVHRQMRKVPSEPREDGRGKMRHELKRYVYMCDGLEHAHKRCQGAEVVEAACEADADKIVRQRRWEGRADGTWLCTAAHVRFAEGAA